MIKFIKKMVNDKKEYKEQMKRVEALPKDYRFVFKKMHEYMWSFAGGDGSNMLKTQLELIELFESKALEGKHVFEVTGEDVVGFYDEFMRDTKKWTDKYCERLNESIAKEISR